MKQNEKKKWVSRKSVSIVTSSSSVDVPPLRDSEQNCRSTDKQPVMAYPDLEKPFVLHVDASEEFCTSVRMVHLELLHMDQGHWRQQNAITGCTLVQTQTHLHPPLFSHTPAVSLLSCGWMHLSPPGWPTVMLSSSRSLSRPFKSSNKSKTEDPDEIAWIRTYHLSLHTLT